MFLHVSQLTQKGFEMLQKKLEETHRSSIKWTLKELNSCKSFEVLNGT